MTDLQLAITRDLANCAHALRIMMHCQHTFFEKAPVGYRCLDCGYTVKASSDIGREIIKMIHLVGVETPRDGRTVIEIHDRTAIEMHDMAALRAGKKGAEVIPYGKETLNGSAIENCAG